MPWFRGQLIVILLVLSALISPFLFFSTDRSPWAEGKLSFLGTLQELVYPFEYAWKSSVNFISHLSSQYFFLVGVERENEVLKKENVRLQAQLLDYKYQVREVERLRNILDFSKTVEKELFIVEVVGTLGRAPFKIIRVKGGSRDGIGVGMPVVSPRGIVGKVLRTGLKYSDIQKIGDVNFNLDVLIERNRIRGILKGMDEERCILQLHRRADVRIGDTLVSSGMTGIFPKGLPVGTVVRISYEMDNISQLVTVKPWVDPESLDELVILKQTSSSMDLILDTAGKEWVDKTTQVY